MKTLNYTITFTSGPLLGMTIDQTLDFLDEALVNAWLAGVAQSKHVNYKIIGCSIVAKKKRRAA